VRRDGARVPPRIGSGFRRLPPVTSAGSAASPPRTASEGGFRPRAPLATGDRPPIMLFAMPLHSTSSRSPSGPKSTNAPEPSAKRKSPQRFDLSRTPATAAGTKIAKGHQHRGVRPEDRVRAAFSVSAGQAGEAQSLASVSSTRGRGGNLERGPKGTRQAASSRSKKASRSKWRAKS